MDFNYYLDPITKQYFDFQGVTARRPFWMFVLFNVLIATVIYTVALMIHIPQIYVLYVLAVFLPGLGLEVRRLHDIGKSGWWVLIAVIPLLGAIYLIYLFCQPSSEPYGG